ncbi:MAG TPA: 2Fe-2S iron-sulfur cluster binding domain-containing protein [Planctomycetaceae bacterium]|nr:2Fe-2S iron-sulfur cluster binding domain-containing protein [Planctomycetaceae bacterium]HIQ20864.1 2Fe-2S iron-sulfur cluster binding domain-containing protein [Planctomycetota bacterium]
MATIIIDGREIEVPDHERLNLIEAARRVGVEIPHYCWHPGLSVVGSCRMCLVEIGRRDPATGQVQMMPKLMPACNTPIQDGMVVVTDSPKVRRARAMVEEDLLLRHPVDCPICDKAGECRLQDYHFRYGQPERRGDVRPFSSRRQELGPRITLFVDRCILCTRCVRFTREVSGTAELMVRARGTHEQIDVVDGFPLDNKLAGNVVDLCPVGALGDKDFLYRQRVWFMRSHASVCTRCAAGCSIWVDENQDRIYRVRPRENPQVNRWWICDDGRYDYHHVHDPRRLVAPVCREGSGLVPIDWPELLGRLSDQLARARPLAAVFSPFLTVEEAYLLARYIRGLDPEALLVLGPIPREGEDERFPGGFTIAAEKCPNRRGVEKVVAHMAGEVAVFERLLSELDGGTIRGVWVSGGYRQEWIDATTAARFDGLQQLVVQDLFPSPLTERATYALPGAAAAERDGSYVNRTDQLQSVSWAVRPPSGVRPEGSLLWALLGRQRLYDARAVLREVAAEIGHFHVAAEPIPEVGVNLKVNLLARSEGPAGEAEGVRQTRPS